MLYLTVLLWSMHWLLVTANVPTSLILVNLMMEVLYSSETSVLTRVTLHNIPEDSIFHSHRHENLQSYIKKNIQHKLKEHIIMTKWTKLYPPIFNIHAKAWNKTSSTSSFIMSGNKYMNNNAKMKHLFINADMSP
jgi:hypothetical protein